MRRNIALVIFSMFAISTSLVFADTTSSTQPVATPPSIILLAPNGGEAIQNGGNYLIRWATRGLPSDAIVSIYLRQGNNIIQNIVTSFPASAGSYLWTDIRGELSNSYQVEIWASGGVGDISDGYFGIKILTPEEIASSTAQAAISGTPPEVSKNLFNKDLYYGLKNDADVRTLQESLKTAGVYAGPITGNFFSKTRKAVIDFQKKNNFTIVPDTGFVGPYTRKVLNGLYVKP